MLKRAEIKDLSISVRRVIDALDAGQLSASGATRHRLEGAVAALEAVLGDRSSLLESLGLDNK